MEKMVNDFYKNKKVFITGHTGFKGAWLSQMLLHLGSNIKGYSKGAEIISLYNILELDSRVESVYENIQNLESLKKAILEFKPDIVFHLAAQPLVIESYKNPVETYSTNVMGTVNLMEAISICDSIKSVVNVTTDKVYENMESSSGYVENDRLCGSDPYSNSKSCSELVTYSYKQSFFSERSQISISTARSGNVIGGGDFSKNRIIPDCIKFASQNKEIIVRNPNSIRPYQHVIDCLYGYLKLAQKQYENKSYEGSYNFGPDDKDIIKTGELVDIFCKIWGNSQTWKNINVKGPYETDILKLKNQKSKDILEWNPKWNINESVKKTVDWSRVYLENKNEIIKKTEEQIESFLNNEEF